MGLLINGEWHQRDFRRANEKGEFVRNESPYRDFIGDETSRFAAEANRYHLFVNAGCPWAYRTILYLAIKNLSHLISISYTEPAMGQQGWTFGDDQESLLGAQHLHDVYTADDSQFTGRATVPILWDKKNHVIVNNESADIIRMFNSAFTGFDGVYDTDYYPVDKAVEIDQYNVEIYETINNGVYRCGFAQSQAAYNDAFDRLFATMDKLDSLLSERRYLCGSTITESDWRLFATLVRFDTAYYGQFRCNRNLLTEFNSLWPYTRDLYQQPDVARTVDIDAIKGIYYGSRAPGILPRGPEINFAEPHNRA